MKNKTVSKIIFLYSMLILIILCNSISVANDLYYGDANEHNNIILGLISSEQYTRNMNEDNYYWQYYQGIQPRYNCSTDGVIVSVNIVSEYAEGNLYCCVVNTDNNSILYTFEPFSIIDILGYRNIFFNMTNRMNLTSGVLYGIELMYDGGQYEVEICLDENNNCFWWGCSGHYINYTSFESFKTPDYFTLCESGWIHNFAFNVSYNIGSSLIDTGDENETIYQVGGTMNIEIDSFIVLLAYLFILLYLIFSNKTNDMFLRTHTHQIFIMFTVILLLGIEVGSFITDLGMNELQRAMLSPFLIVFIILLWLTRKNK